MIEVLAYISLLFVGFQLLNAIFNLLFSQKLRRKKEYNNELISICIPARNEEKNIAHILRKLQGIKKGNIEILIYDDESTDDTAKIIKSYAAFDPRIRTINSQTLPEGWLGKNHACYQLAKEAKGDYLLFIDADVLISREVVFDAVAHLKRFQLTLLSIFPTQIMKTWGEKASVPIMNFILLSLLPLIFVRKSPFNSHSAANGQFMLFDAKKYRSIQPHEKFKNSAVEDIKIARYLKRNKYKIACLAGESRVECRMYNNYTEALNGFAKNVFMFFGNQPIIAFLFWLLSYLAWIPMILLGTKWLAIYALAFILVHISTSISSKQNSFINLLLLPAHAWFMIQVLTKAFKIKRTKIHSWKGRNIYSS